LCAHYIKNAAYNYPLYGGQIQGLRHEAVAFANCARTILKMPHLILLLFSFMAGKYKDYDMKPLNLTIVRDYSLYLALKSAGQGIGEKVI
jgi:hypothetical protein